MSLSSPSDILVKLEELKKWQERQQKRLIDDHNKRLNNSDSIQDVEFENRRLSEPKNDEKEKPKPSKRSVPNSNPDHNEVRVDAKPKQPFLRKGTGLARYRMTKMKPSVRLKEKCKQKYVKEVPTEKDDRKGSKCVSFSTKLDSAKQLSANLQLARATWNNNNLPPIVDDSNSSNLGFVPLTTQNLAAASLAVPEVEHRENLPVLVTDGEDNKGNETLTSERELVIFETLEKRVAQNSFSSTNSSILRFLSSTPHKHAPKNSTSGRISKQPKQTQKVYNNGNHFEAVYEQNSEEQSPRIEEIENDDDGIQVLKDNDKIIENNAQQFKKIEAYEQKLQDDYLSLIEKAIKLKEFVVGDQKSCSSTSSVHSSDLEDVTEENTLHKFDDESKWSDSESVKSQQSSSTLSSIKSSISLQCTKCDAETMTDMFEFEQIGMERELKRLRAENFKVTKIQSEFEQEKKEFEKYKKEILKHVEEEKVRINLVLQEDKKKLAKEKMVFEQYVKDLQNKPSKKEREEISALKSKVATLEETLKLKETRNGMSQARLRNQIKVLEKKTADLQKEVENLTKQNAKLTASQSSRKNPSDTKILHQINKNLSKLAQEQLEKMMPVPNENQSDNRSGVRKILSRVSETKENDKNVNNVEDVGTFSNSIEEFYEKTFGRKSYDSEKTFGMKSYDSEKMVDEKCYESENEITQEPKKSDRTETNLEDGSKQVEYRNGNVKTISPDGNVIIFKYYNGDFKETNLLKGTVKYYYHKSQVSHITNADGTELIQYPDGQTEKRQKDGKCEVEYPNGICRVLSGDLEEISYPDGTKVSIKNNGDRVITLPNGQREIHTTEFKRREYPDGTVKILYPDGLQETRYANGRTRLKDKNGKLLMDSESAIT